MSRVVLLLLCVGLYACSASTASAPAAPSAAQSPPPLPADPRLVQGTLDNGVKYILRRHKAEDERAHLVLVVRAGSLHEEEDQRGFAHFVEHMAFNGTARFEHGALVDFFERSGMGFGSHANAFTTYDRTQFMLRVPTDDPALLEQALDVLADWASAVSFDPEEVEQERGVMLSEWTAHLGAARRLGEQQSRLLFAGSRFAERDVGGDQTVLREGPRQRLVDFYRTWYRPERMAVVAVGDIDPAAVQAGIEKRFGPMKASSPAAPEPDAAIPVEAAVVAETLTDPELPAISAQIVVKAPGRVAVTEADVRAQLLQVLPAWMLNRRLAELSAKPEAPFTQAVSQFQPALFGQLSLLALSARSKEGQLLPTVEALATELKRVEQHGFLQAELDRTSSDFLRFLERQVQSEQTMNGGAIANVLAGHFVTGEVSTSPQYDLELAKRLLSGLELSELEGSVRQMLSQGQTLVLGTGPASEAMPERTALHGSWTRTLEQAVSAYVEPETESELLAELPAPGSIQAESTIEEIDTTVWTLSNGARVVLKPTQFKKDEVLLQSTSYGGFAQASDEAFEAVRFASDVANVSGAGSFDRQALGRMLTGKVLRVTPWIGEQEEGISASAAPADLETMLQVVYLFATQPRRDPAAFEAFRQAVRENLRNRSLQPAHVFGDAFSRKVWDGSVRRLSPSLESLEQLDLNRIVDFYEDRFSDFSDFTFVFVGDFELPVLRPLVERYLASLPGGGRQEEPRDLGLHRPAGVTSLTVHAGQEDQALVRRRYHGEAPWSDPAHTDLYTLSQYLDIRLREVLREKMGGVYVPQIGSGFDRIPYEHYTLTISYTCKPADIPALEQATLEVIEDVRQHGVQPDYLDKLRSIRTRALEEDYRSNGFWLSRLLNQFKLGRDPREILILHDLTQRITSENLQNAARTFLREDRVIDAKLLPEG